MASAEGSFLPAASAWYPAPAPLFSYRVSVSVPGDQRALVPGRLRSETLPRDRNDRYRASFEFAHPASGIDLMAGRWIIGERIVPRTNRAPLRLRTYFSRELDAIAGLSDGYLDDSRRYLERYAVEIGDYPYTEFSVVASPLPTGFGMPTLTYHRRGGAEAAVHPRHVARPRSAAQLVGQRRLRRLRRRQLVRRADHVHGGLRLQGARVGRGGARDAPRVAARFCRGVRRRGPDAGLAFARGHTVRRRPSGMASRRCCSSCCATRSAKTPSGGAFARSGNSSNSALLHGAICRSRSNVRRGGRSHPFSING